MESLDSIHLWWICASLWKWKLLTYVWLCLPMGSTVHGILQARKLEWVAFPFSGGSSQPWHRSQVSHIAGGFFTSWTTREVWQLIDKAGVQLTRMKYSVNERDGISEQGRPQGPCWSSVTWVHLGQKPQNVTHNAVGFALLAVVAFKLWC